MSQEMSQSQNADKLQIFSQIASRGDPYQNYEGNL